MTTGRPSLFEFAGGEPAFLALAEAHHARCLADPELNHPFSHDNLNPEHISRLATYWAEVMGGPSTFSERCGGHSTMLRMHVGHGDMSDLGQRFVSCFIGAMEDARLPKDERFRASMRAYMVWAVGEVLFYEQPEDIPPDLPMPTWTWLD